MKLLHFVFVFLLVSPLAAQTTTTTTTTQPVAQEIVVTASAVPDSVEETPASVTVIHREDIERREARDVSDVLREVPGVAVSRTGSNGKATSLFIRGGSSKQALVLWNGIPLNNPYFSGYNFGQMSTAGVERVEVVRGPFSALYGSEAVSGVVNVLTTPSRSGAVVEVAGGGHGLVNALASGAYASDRWSANASAEHRQDDGFAANDDFRSTTFLGGLTFRPIDHLSIGVLGRRSTYDLGIPFNVNAAADAFEPSPARGEDGTESQFAVPVRFDGGRIAYELHYAENRRDDHFADPLGAFGPEEATTHARVRTARATASGKSALGMITIGGELGRDAVDHRDNFAQFDTRRRKSDSVFAEDQLGFGAGSGRVELTAGIRYDHYDTFGSETTPRLAAAWLRGGHKIRAAYGEGFRAPSIGELYFPFGGNLNLGPERSRNVEIGYDRFTNVATLSATLFRSQYRGLIAFGSSGSFENVQRANANGVELAASHHAGPFDVALSYTFLKTEDQATGEELLRRPKHSGSLSFGYNAGNYDAELVVTHQGARADVTDLFPFGTVNAEAFTTADVTVRTHVGALAPYVKLENLTNTRYQEVFGYASPGRRAVAGLRYTIR
ncbi:MAG: TonB-dependent receptor [Acidobacteria bacterium]|nr:TonB-dependent receptor [Acidobacteriota bacterium]MBV9477403.1 TonB-dependent receptor [Acidobacteriota bacterium]